MPRADRGQYLAASHEAGRGAAPLARALQPGGCAGAREPRWGSRARRAAGLAPPSSEPARAPSGASRHPLRGHPKGRADARWSLLAAFAVTSSLSCAATPVPCRSPSACAAGTECLAHRCLPLGAEPVGLGTRRVVLEPADIAVRGSDAGPGGLPPLVAFGGAAGESLLVRFPPLSQGPSLELDAAFLLLEPAAFAEPSAEDVRLEVALAASAWSSADPSRATERPARRGPISVALARTRPPQPLRIDVTAQVRELAQHPVDDHGFVLRAAGASRRAAAYSTGSDGPAPRLDVYSRPRRERR